ncbi:RHS repeat-associated core domain-containing protein, partial [Dysgonomonas sp. Shenzhen-Wh21]
YGKDYTEDNKYKNKGLLTGVIKAQQLSDGSISPTYLYSVMYYDNRERLIQTKSNNHLSGGIEQEYIAYNFMGQLTKKKHIHQATGKTTQTEIYAYTYDHAGRITKETYQLNGATAVILAENTYDELGRLKTNKKGGVANALSTYGYNIRSWTKSITSPLFTQTLYYNDVYGGSTKQYNGNVGAMSWKLSSETNTLGYVFIYDNLSRLITSNYLVNGTANTNYKEAYTYDKHGNIATLQRYGKTAASTYALIDNLTMTYTGNQLLKADDAVATISLAESADFKNYSSVATEYFYNANGAMSKDFNKGITEIQYNSLNLPRQMDIKSPVAEARNEYTYSAGGQKLKVVQKWNPNYSTTPVIGSAINTAALTQTKTTDYVDNKIYENGTLKRILVDGGYIEGGVYHYYLTDHLGNNRVVLNASGTVIQKNHYYPFGTTFAESTVTEQGKQPYKYNGKELDQMHGLNLYDYSARYYESAIGRFLSVDPLAELHYDNSPYAYVLNNPLKYIDINGMDTTYINPKGETIVVIPGGGNVTITTANDVIVEPETSSYMPILTFGIGVSGTATSTYAGLHYTQRPWGTGYFQTSRGNYYSLSVLKPNANGKYVKGVQGLRYGALYAKKSVRIPAKIGSSLSWISLGISGINFYNNQSLSNGIDLGISAAGIIYWEAAVPYTYFQVVGQPNIDQIKENIKTNQNPLNNTINPTTGEYYVPGYFDGFGF